MGSGCNTRSGRVPVAILAPAEDPVALLRVGHSSLGGFFLLGDCPLGWFRGSLVVPAVFFFLAGFLLGLAGTVMICTIYASKYAGLAPISCILHLRFLFRRIPVKLQLYYVSIV